RLQRDDADEVLTYFPAIRRNELFALGAGPAFLSVEGGLCVGFGESRESRKQLSIVAWRQPDVSNINTREMTSNEESLLVDCTDAEFSNSYWSELVGGLIKGLAIVTIDDSGELRRARNERGLLVKTDHGREWLAATQLRERGPGHFLLMRR